MHTFFLDIKGDHGYDKVMEVIRAMSVTHTKVAPLRGYKHRIEVQGSDTHLKAFHKLNENLQIPGGLSITHDELGML